MKLLNYIGGDWVDSDDAIEIFNPANGERIGSVAAASEADVDRALEQAQKASLVYGALTINERKTLIDSVITKLKEAESEIVNLLVEETGKTHEIASYDFNMLVDCLSYYVEEVKRHYGETIPDYDGGHLNFLSYQPIGVVAAVLTWNFPLLNLGYKLGPALASGCASVIKISERTPMASMRVAELIHEIGFPAGTVNFLCGGGRVVIPALARSKIPRMLTMIGSTLAGKKMIEASPTTVKRFSLELGGDAPVLVFDDADFDAAVADVVGLKLANAGQICVAPNRVFVHESIYEAFIEKAKALMESYRFLDDSGNGPELSPLCTKASLEQMVDFCQPANHGGIVVTGGKRAERPGYFLEPTLIRDVDRNSKLTCEEIFGPIMPVMPFNDSEDIFALANDTVYGLSAYVYTKSLSRALEAEKRLLFGNILINEAFYSLQLPHGGLKQSGFGKDVSRLALDDYYDIKRISIKR
ncbi:MAG: Succinate-semialdehyde dehydrogenase [NADP(+)] GabD [Opitutia bacterium UBA7350]|nr:MAG: Succinate-semialdehyde dehydrogenase [NADP(+)] GabD [Opitutae bacterium UBA7350]